jgi:flagellar biosynthesis/type III secretory pathway M-ring protein FliF/YscJ
MRFIRAYIEQIRRLWVALSLSARLALLLLVMLVSVTLVWLVTAVGSRPQSVALFNTALSDEQNGQARTLLQRENINVRIADGLLTVPADRRDDAVALLASQSILPSDPASELDRLVRESTIWRTRDDTDRLTQELRQEQLARLIARFPGMRTAQVILEPGKPRMLGTPAVSPTAAVSVTLKSGHVMDRQLVKAVADLVSGSMGNMKACDVRIVADGRSYRAKDEQGADLEQMEMVVEQERRFEDKVQNLLQYINGVLVAVYVEPDTVRSRHTEETTYQEPVQATVNKVSEESTNTGRKLAAEPGVKTNSGAVLPSASAGDSATEHTETTNDPRFPSKRTVEDAFGGLVKSVSVSVNVPREFLVEEVKKIKGDKVEPSEAELAEGMAKIKDLVRTCIRATSDNQVVVKYYVGGPAAATQEVAYAGVHLAVGSYGKEAVLGGLALMALVMVLMFARRRAPSPPLLEPPSTEEEQINPEDAVGAIEGEEGALEGLELDDEAVRFQKVVEQIGEMVREKPDAASNLIQRWIDAK